MHVFFFVFITSQLCLKELAKIVKSIVHLNQRAFSGGKVAHRAQHVESKFLGQRLNPNPLQRKPRVLTTGHQGSPSKEPLQAIMNYGKMSVRFPSWHKW